MTDPVLERRARIARWCAIGKRIGYVLYAGAIVLFFVGFAVGYDGGIATAIIAALLIGGAALIPSIVFAYGVKAAEREEREQGGFSGRR